MPVVDMLFCVAMAEAVSLLPTHGATVSGPDPFRATEQAALLGDAAMKDPLFCLRTATLPPNVALDRVLARPPTTTGLSAERHSGRALATSGEVLRSRAAPDR